MMLTYHISHEKFFSTALYVPGRSGVKSSARINVVVLYLTQIVEKLKGFLTWLTIWQYMSTVVCMHHSLECNVHHVKLH